MTNGASSIGAQGARNAAAPGRPQIGRLPERAGANPLARNGGRDADADGDDDNAAGGEDQVASSYAWPLEDGQDREENVRLGLGLLRRAWRGRLRCRLPRLRHRLRLLPQLFPRKLHQSSHHGDRTALLVDRVGAEHAIGDVLAAAVVVRE